MEIFVKTVYTCTYIHYRFSCIAEKPNISHNLTRNTGLNTHHSTWCCSVQLTIHVHSILYTNPSILNCLYMTACIKCLIINFHEISLLPRFLKKVWVYFCYLVLNCFNDTGRMLSRTAFFKRTYDQINEC